MVPGPTSWQNIHSSQINFEPDSSVTFSAPLLPLIMSDGLGWTTAPSSRPIFDNSGRADADFALPAFLPCLPLWCRSANSSSASADCRFAEFRRPWRQIGELIFAPRVSRECTSECIEVRERGTDCCAPYLGGSFCGMHPQHVCVCVLVIVWDGHCSVCAATGMETALSETHDPRVGRPFQHAREYFPPAMFHFQSDFCCLDGSFSIRFVFSRSLWIKRPIGFWLEGEASSIYFSLTSQNTGHTTV